MSNLTRPSVLHLERHSIPTGVLWQAQILTHSRLHSSTSCSSLSTRNSSVLKALPTLRSWLLIYTYIYIYIGIFVFCIILCIVFCIVLYRICICIFCRAQRSTSVFPYTPNFTLLHCINYAIMQNKNPPAAHFKRQPPHTAYFSL